MRKGFKDWRETPTGVATARLLSLAGRRWALRAIWELRGGALNFRSLQAACGHISPSVLQSRLHELQRAGVIEKIPRLGYRLSREGERVCQALAPLDEWARDHEADLQRSDKLLNKK